MSTIMEFLGLSPAGLNGDPGALPEESRGRSGVRPARASTSCAATSGPRRSSRCEAIENAAASVVATGGSTNGVLHLLAIAHEFGLAVHDRRLRPDRRAGRRCSRT